MFFLRHIYAQRDKSFKGVCTTHKMKFSIKELFHKRSFPQETADLVTFTEEILNGKLYFLCSVE